ncbi:carbohydrate kinase [Corynebacterium sp. NML130628]|uniref:carbohydrate kinase family protein n=1 Tax=Corynebacterium sp. NML130628 TaxID=1906333 RepID=UPI0009F990E4|nr:carbohydrate kinase [Corynebacterium sp. NML130628]
MITVYGEALVDLVPQDPSPLAPLVPALGGGPFNVARALGRLGADVSFQSRLSRDNFGEALAQSLLHAHVDLTNCGRGDEPTTLAVTALAENGSATYTFYVDGTADRFAQPVPVQEGYAVFGTLSLALEPASLRYAEAASQSAKHGAIVCLDPNIRPAFASEKHRLFLRGLLDSVTVLKLSDEEVEFLGDTSHVPVVVTTLGADGLRVCAPFGTVTVPSPKVTVADTIGAGDTVMAALVHQFDARGLDRNALLALGEEEWREILSFATRAAAITVSRTGADTPFAHELD